METIRFARHRDKLQKRRVEVAVTLRYVGNEQKQVEENTDWLDRAAFESRVNLLGRLNEWYLTEMDQIDKALDRIKNSIYGFCRACHTPIDSGRLEIHPEAEFCAACQKFREELTAD
jgi:RNA polymerase-binding protein DksA